MNNTRALAAGILLSFYSCSPPVQRIHLSCDMEHPEQLSELRRMVPLRGSGRVEYAVDNERQSGWYDVHYRRDSTFSASFYSSFGTIVGTVIAADDSGTVSFQGKTYSLSSGQTLDTFSFPLAGELRLEDLTSSLCGKITPSINIPRCPPDEIQTGINRIICKWKGPEKEISVLFSRTLRRLKRILVKCSPAKGRNYSIHYGSFFGGFARIITFKVDDRNYFSIQCKRLRKEAQGL